jgi:hypothetical protein
MRLDAFLHGHPAHWVTDMARQLAIWAALLFAIGLIAAAIAPQQPARQAPVFPAPRLPGNAGAAVVEATLPDTQPVTATVGDIVRLRVDASFDQHVEIDGLGVRGPVGPGTTSVVEFVADSPGRWPVRLGAGGPRIGTVEVQQ